MIRRFVYTGLSWGIGMYYRVAGRGGMIASIRFSVLSGSLEKKSSLVIFSTASTLCMYFSSFW